jgi:hypothetical protein
MSTKQPEVTIALPPGITAADLKHEGPKGHGDAAWKRYQEWMKGDGALVDDPRELELYYTERFGWCITTLFISRGRDYADRSYGITLKGEMVRVGKGPHVKRTVRVYLRRSRLADLQQYLDLYLKGLEAAHNTRDSISTRRAQTANRRSLWRFP